MRAPPWRGEAISFYHSDHLGSSNVVTDSSGNQVGCTEFTPYGSTFRQTGSYDPKFKFTGKELDASTGLYFYGARYYDPQIGRFATADTIVQAPYDPQSFNRYSYCRNNPINYVDPTGHSWKSFWKKWGNLIDPMARAVITGDWSTMKNAGIAFATTFVFSGFNPIAATAAFLTTIALDNPIGQGYVKFQAEEINDDILGMRPKSAYITAYVTTSIGLSLWFETMLSNMVAVPAQISNDPVKAKDIENPKGYDPWGRYPGAEKSGRKGFEYSQMNKLTDKAGNSLAVTGRGAKDGGLSKLIPGKAWDPIHTGAIGTNFQYEGVIPRGPNWTYGTVFGTCHQASNATLLFSGLSNTVAEIYPHWSTFTSTIIYGNYGGGLVRSTGSGIIATEEYDKR